MTFHLVIQLFISVLTVLADENLNTIKVVNNNMRLPHFKLHFLNKLDYTVYPSSHTSSIPGIADYGIDLLHFMQRGSVFLPI